MCGRCVLAIVLCSVSAAGCASRPTRSLSSAEVSGFLNAPPVEPPAVAGSWLKEPSAYRGVRWCTSERSLGQVLQTSGCGDIEEPSARHRYCSAAGQLGAAQVSEVYEFKNDHLVSVSVEFTGRNPDEVIALLVESFGSPTRRFSNVINRRTSIEFTLEDLRWDGRESTLSFEHVVAGHPTEVPGGPTAFLSTKKCGVNP